MVKRKARKYTIVKRHIRKGKVIKAHKRRLPIKRRPPIKKMWRVTHAINYVRARKYYSIRLQRWSKSRETLEDLESALETEIYTALEHHLGYERIDWWTTAKFPWIYGRGYQQVPYDKDLLGKTEIAHEQPVVEDEEDEL